MSNKNEFNFRSRQNNSKKNKFESGTYLSNSVPGQRGDIGLIFKMFYHENGDENVMSFLREAMQLSYHMEV